MNMTSENRRFDAGRFRGGRGYGSGSGSVIWERRKREKAWLKGGRFGSASGIRRTINATLLPLSLSGRLLQVIVAISPPAAKGTSKDRFSARIRLEGPPQANTDF